MATLDELASRLAEDTLKAMDQTGQERLYMEVAGVLAASSQSLEEAFLTEMRVRLSERTARQFLNRKITEAQPQASPPKAN
ncbi:MAG: hypothetical protein JJ897_18350 [Marinibacterium sp.]|nr:hypothetical protein [Marinibacterium sp.]